VLFCIDLPDSGTHHLKSLTAWQTLLIIRGSRALRPEMFLECSKNGANATEH
jgi:hypothetical protein